MRKALALFVSLALALPGLAAAQAKAPASGTEAPPAPAEPPRAEPGPSAATPQPSPGAGPAAPAQPPANPLTVLAEVVGTVKAIDRDTHRLDVDAAGETVAVTLDRNTMVYTPRGLGSVHDIQPGAEVRVGRNAKYLAYWVQVRPRGAADTPVSTPAQGSSPTTGAGAPAEGGGVAPPTGTAPGGGTATAPGTAPGGTR